MTPEQAELEFSNWLAQQGFGEPHIPANTDWNNFDLPGDRPGSKHGSAKLNFGATIDGVYKDFRAPDKLFIWRPGNGTTANFTDEEHQALAAEAERKACEKKEAQEATRTKAMNLYRRSLAATPEHPYLLKKKIRDVGPLKISGKSLIVPIYNSRTDEFQTIQYIPPDGKKKRFPKNAVKTGGYIMLGSHPVIGKRQGKRDKAFPIIICEGYATAYAIHSTMFTTSLRCDCVISALDAGNLKVVAKALHDRFPDHNFIIAADNDIGQVKKLGFNPGIDGATKAAIAIGRKIAVPPLDGDFWDLWDKEGDAAVKRLIDEAVEPTAEPLAEQAAAEQDAPWKSPDPPPDETETAPQEQPEQAKKKPKPLPESVLRIANMLPWRERRSNSFPTASFYNVRLGIVAMGIECRHDLFRDVTIIGYKGGNIVHEVKPLIGELTNAALMRLRVLFSDRYCFDPKDENILDAVKSLAFENCFDPILDMLTEAEGKWDGVKRLDTWVVDYFGCEATELNCAIGRKVLIAAVRRARVPGCKFDTITVLESPEGQNKSTAIRILAGDEFFSDQSILGVRDKEVQEQLSGIWMHESADLTGMRKADDLHVKAFASRQADRARPAYGRVVEKKPRRSIDWATTNDSEYLRSQTGNRRFWPLAVGLIDIEKLKRDRLQLLGEAAKAESAGESITLEEALWDDAAAAQEERRTKDPWEDLIDAMEYAGTVTMNSAVIHLVDGQERVATSDILDNVLQIPPAQQHNGHSMRLANAMKRLGWKRDGSNKITIKGKQVRGYYRPCKT